MAKGSQSARNPRKKEAASSRVPPKEGMDFVGKLAFDKKFRARFLKNPQRVLSEYHIEIPNGIDLGKVELPTMEEMQKVMNSLTLGDEFRPNMTAAMPFLLFLIFFVPVVYVYRMRPRT
jgi:hypothetical protein